MSSRIHEMVAESEGLAVLWIGFAVEDRCKESGGICSWIPMKRRANSQARPVENLKRRDGNVGRNEKHAFTRLSQE